MTVGVPQGDVHEEGLVQLVLRVSELQGKGVGGHLANVLVVGLEDGQLLQGAVRVVHVGEEVERVGNLGADVQVGGHVGEVGRVGHRNDHHLEERNVPLARLVHHMDGHHRLSVPVGQGYELEPQLARNVLSVHVEQVLGLVGHVDLHCAHVIVVHVVEQVQHVLLVLVDVDDLGHRAQELRRVVPRPVPNLPVVQYRLPREADLVDGHGPQLRALDVEVPGDEPYPFPPVRVGVVEGIVDLDPLLPVQVVEGHVDGVPVRVHHQGDGVEEVVLVRGGGEEEGGGTGVVYLDVGQQGRAVSHGVVRLGLYGGVEQAQGPRVPGEAPHLGPGLVGRTYLHPSGPVEVREHHPHSVVGRAHDQLAGSRQVVALDG